MKYKRIILLGFRCVGKNYVSEILSEKLNMKLINMDLEIEKQEGKTIAEISDNGKDWVKFREAELSILKDLLKEDNIVISAGGGVGVNDVKIPNTDKTYGEIETEILKNDKDTLKILLTADEKVIKDRLIKYEREKRGARPILDSKLAKSQECDSLEKIVNHNMEIFQKRKKYYENLADLIVVNNGNNLNIKEILEYVGFDKN
jgi:shikimate kinase